MNLNEASQWAFEISKKRNQYKGDGNDTIRALKHCACEVVEAVDAYDCWHNEDYENTKEEFENEIARKMLINEGRAKK